MFGVISKRGLLKRSASLPPSSVVFMMLCVNHTDVSLPGRAVSSLPIGALLAFVIWLAIGSQRQSAVFGRVFIFLSKVSQRRNANAFLARELLNPLPHYPSFAFKPSSAKRLYICDGPSKRRHLHCSWLFICCLSSHAAD